jgi:hypothetical protein
MAITLILVSCCSRLNLIYAVRVLYCNFYLNLHVRVTLKTLHQLDLIVFDGTFVMRAISIKFDHLGLLRLPSVKFDLLLNQLNINYLVSGID